MTTSWTPSVAKKRFKSIDKASTNADDTNILYPDKFLNSLKFPGLLNHELKLKVGVPVMLLRNINQSNGLSKGKRLIIKQPGKRFMQAENITPLNAGTQVFIPRINIH